ncbi:hypothetical protein MMC12_004514 [Toensbergia leucococca]|nr:hypothetical protein [Toensbergia leucococca]
MLTHITLDPITLDDILALRWGPFSSFGDANWMDAKIWRGIKSLGIGLVPWWGDIAGYKKTEDTAQRQQQKERWRVGVKVLHDWIGSFGVGLERIIFEWKGAEGPNPLLLDIVAARRGIGRWFSAPEVKWKGLREVWLGACWIGREEIFELMERMGQLEILMVWKGWVGAGINGTVKMVDGREWVEVSWGDDEVSRLNEMTMVEIGKAAMGDLQMPGNVGLREVVGKVAGASENMEDDDSFAWSDDSMVVPFVLHT